MLQDKFYRTLIKEARIGLVLVDMQGNFIDFNTEYEMIIGYDLETAQTMDYCDITPRRWEVMEQRLLEVIKESGKYGPYVKQYIHPKKGLVPVRLYLKRVVLENETYIWSTVQTATDEEIRLALELLKVVGVADDEGDMPFEKKKPARQ